MKNNPQTAFSPRIESAIEQIRHRLVLASMDESKHLKEREEQYVDVAISTPGGILVIKENEEGWWKESYNFKGDVTKQIQKLKDDPTVIYGVYTTFRFNEPGGWYDIG